MTRPYTCPVHGRIEGLGVCWVGGCMYDARDTESEGNSAVEREAGRTDKEGSGGPDPRTGEKAPAVRSAEPRTLVLPWDVLESSNKRTSVMDPRRREYAAALEAARAEVAVQVQAQGWSPLTGTVCVRMIYHPPDRRVRDCSNMDKLVMDALEGPEDIPGVYENDRQVKEWAGFEREPDPVRPRVEITVEPAGVSRSGAA